MTLPVLILAAGFGTRLRPLTEQQPKALIEVGGMALIDHALRQARSLPASRIAVNAHYRADLLRAHLSDATDVTLLHEQPQILDSGGAVKNARSRLGDGPLLTMNADNAWDGPNPLAFLVNAWAENRFGGLLLLVENENAVGRQEGGDFTVDTSGRLAPSKSGLVYTGAQILGPGVGSDFTADVFSMWEIWTRLLDQGRLYGIVYPGRWADIGHPAGIGLAEAMLSEGGIV